MLLPYAAGLCVKFFLHGSRDITAFEGTPSTAVERTTDRPREQALLIQALEVVKVTALRRKCKRLRDDSGGQNVSNRGPKSADHRAAGITPKCLQKFVNSNQFKLLHARLEFDGVRDFITLLDVIRQTLRYTALNRPLPYPSQVKTEVKRISHTLMQLESGCRTTCGAAR